MSKRASAFSDTGSQHGNGRPQADTDAASSSYRRTSCNTCATGSRPRCGRRRQARTLTDIIEDLNPVIIGWRNYYRYANRAWEEFATLDWWLGPAHHVLGAEKTRQSVVGGHPPYLPTVQKWEADAMATGQHTHRSVRRSQAPTLPRPGHTHTERMEQPGRVVPQRSRQVLGCNQRPCEAVRATPVANGYAWRAGCRETCTSGSARGMKKPTPATGQGASSLLYIGVHRFARSDTGRRFRRVSRGARPLEARGRRQLAAARLTCEMRNGGQGRPCGADDSAQQMHARITRPVGRDIAEPNLEGARELDQIRSIRSAGSCGRPNSSA